MTEPDDLADWRTGLKLVEDAGTVWVVQLATGWFRNSAWAVIRDDLDLALFRAALCGRHALDIRRVLLYDPPSDLGTAPCDYQRAKLVHQQWLARLRRQLAALGAENSAGGLAAGRCNYRARLVILPRVGQPPTIEIEDGIWANATPPAKVAAAWDANGLIPLDPHEENIVGPHSDRNPLWAGSLT